MAVTQEEISQFFELKAASLRALARLRLPNNRLDYADDVVSGVALALCEHSDEIENIEKYAASCLWNLCKKYFSRPMAGELQLIGYGLSDGSTPENLMLQYESEKLASERRERIIRGIGPTLRAHYRDWESVEFTATTHSERCKVTRIRRAIAAKSGANIPKYLRGTNKGWKARAATA